MIAFNGSIAVKNPDDIDLAAVVEQFQADNERLREQIARIKLNPPTWWESFNIQDVQDILTDNFFWLGVAVGVVAAIAYGLAPLFLWERKRER